MTDEQYNALVDEWERELRELIKAYRAKGIEPDDLIGALEGASSKLIDQVAGL